MPDTVNVVQVYQIEIGEQMWEKIRTDEGVVIKPTPQVQFVITLDSNIRELVNVLLTGKDPEDKDEPAQT